MAQPRSSISFLCKYQNSYLSEICPIEMLKKDNNFEERQNKLKGLYAQEAYQILCKVDEFNIKIKVATFPENYEDHELSYIMYDTKYDVYAGVWNKYKGKDVPLPIRVLLKMSQYENSCLRAICSIEDLQKTGYTFLEMQNDLQQMYRNPRFKEICNAHVYKIHVKRVVYDDLSKSYILHDSANNVYAGVFNQGKEEEIPGPIDAFIELSKNVSE